VQSIEAQIAKDRCAIDHAHAFLRHVVARGDERRGVMRIGDDAIAARHDAAVERLERHAAAIGAVIGGDEWKLGAARSE